MLCLAPSLSKPAKSFMRLKYMPTGIYKRTIGHGAKHGMSGNNRFYKVWRNMMSRCTNPKTKQWKDYGGRGILVCEYWLNFEGFKINMLTSYQEHVRDFGEKDTVLDRTDNDKGYRLANCAWVTRHESRINSRKPEIEKRLTHGGISDTVQGWADRLKMNHQTLRARLSRMPLNKALTLPLCQWQQRSPSKPKKK